MIAIKITPAIGIDFFQSNILHINIRINIPSPHKIGFPGLIKTSKIATAAPTIDPNILVFPAFNGESFSLSIVNIVAITVKNGYSNCSRFETSRLISTAKEIFISFMPKSSFVVTLLKLTIILFSFHMVHKPAVVYS